MGSRGEQRTNDALMTPAELAAFLRVSPATVERWRWEGDGPPPVRLGYRTIRYRRADVERFLRSRTDR